ncbi:unnamed protein product [Closterium sp. Yama58-4]|nr:unnamed protein product [Closterium sp. Yama58-4]
MIVLPHPYPPLLSTIWISSALAFGQSATSTSTSSSGGFADGAANGGSANGGAFAAGADTAEGDTNGRSSDGLSNQPDNASAGRTPEEVEEEEEGEGETGGVRKEAENAEDVKVKTGEGEEQEGGDGGAKEAEEEGGEQTSSEGGEEEGESSPLADTPEKLEKWFKSWRENTSAVLPPGFKDASTMEVVELDDWPPVPVPLPNLGEDVRADPSLDPNAWRPFHVKGTPRIITVFSAECSPYMDWQSVAMAYSFKRSGQPGKLVRLLACNEDALKGYRGLDIAPTMVVPNWSRGPRTGDWYPAINKPVGVKYWLDNSPDANDVEWVLIMDADQLIRRPVLPWELGAERGHPVSANYGYLKGCDNSFGELHMNNATYCDKVSCPIVILIDKVGGYIVIHVEDLRRLAPIWSAKSEEVTIPSCVPSLSPSTPTTHNDTQPHQERGDAGRCGALHHQPPFFPFILPPLPPFNRTQPHPTTPCTQVGGYIVIHVEDLRRLAPIWSSKSEEVRADVEHYTINATGDVHGQRWISEMYGYSFGSSDVSLKHIALCITQADWPTLAFNSPPSFSNPLRLFHPLSLSQVGLKHIMIDSAMLYPGYDPPKGVDPRMIHYGLELKVLDWQWDKSAYYRQEMVNTCGQHFPDPPEISALPGNQTYEERRRDFIVIECMAVLNRALREFHRLKRGCLVEWERDVGIMDLEMMERAGLERGFLVVREPREGARARKFGERGGAGEEGNIPSDEDNVAYADSATNEDEGGDGEAGDGEEEEDSKGGEEKAEEQDKPGEGESREGSGEVGSGTNGTGNHGNQTSMNQGNEWRRFLQGYGYQAGGIGGGGSRTVAAGAWVWMHEDQRWMYLGWSAGMVLLFLGVTMRTKRKRRDASAAMRRSKVLLALLALSLVVSLALVPSCRANETDAEDDADGDDLSDAAISADASPPGLVGQLLGASRRFLYSPRMLSCRSDCEDKNKKCNTDYSECKRENKDDKHDHHKCTHTYKKCKKKIKKCRSKCD